MFSTDDVFFFQSIFDLQLVESMDADLWLCRGSWNRLLMRLTLLGAHPPG